MQKKSIRNLSKFTVQFKNKGRFIVDTPDGKALLNYSWLESAYMVRDGDNLKIKFYFSDAVEQTSEPIELIFKRRSLMSSCLKIETAIAIISESISGFSEPKASTPN